MDAGTIVMVTLTKPCERVWGALRELTADGITVQGIRVDCFEDFLRQGDREGEIGFSTAFYATDRLEKIGWDVTDADLGLFASRFKEKMGVTIDEYLSARKT